MASNYNIKGTNNFFTDFIIFNINDLELSKNLNTKGKWHTLYYITGGNGVLQIDFNEHIALKNKVFYIEKYKIINWLRLNNIEGVMVQFTDTFYNLIYTGNPKIKSDQTLLGDFPPFVKVELDEEEEWSSILKLLIQEYEKPSENSKEIICLSLKILMMFFRRKAFIKGKLMIADRKKQLLNEFRKILNNKFSELKTAKEFSQILNISPNYLNAICKDIYNKTVSEIIQERIMLEAKRLLSHTGLSISEISYKLGFKDNSYFGRYFKKVTGLPPEKFRVINYKTRNV